MALINCPECGTQVSDQAPSCIKCGHPLFKSNTPKSEPVKPTNIHSNETQFWKGTPSWIAFLGGYIAVGILGLITVFSVIMQLSGERGGFALGSVFGVAGFCIYYYLNRELENWIIEITDQRIIVKSGWLSSKTEELELFRVKDIRLEEPFLLKTMGLSTILLVTSDRTNHIQLIPAIENGHELREKIRNAVDKRREIKGVKEVDDSRTFLF